MVLTNGSWDKLREPIYQMVRIHGVAGDSVNQTLSRWSTPDGPY